MNWSELVCMCGFRRAGAFMMACVLTTCGRAEERPPADIPAELFFFFTGK